MSRLSLRMAAASMAAELESSRLEVTLIPSRDPLIAARGGKIRIAGAQNPEWYRRLCAGYESARRGRRELFQTRIKRAGTLRALRLIAQGEPAGVYQDRLEPVIRWEMDRQVAQVAYERSAWRARARVSRSARLAVGDG